MPMISCINCILLTVDVKGRFVSKGKIVVLAPLCCMSLSKSGKICVVGLPIQARLAYDLVETFQSWCVRPRLTRPLQLHSHHIDEDGQAVVEGCNEGAFLDITDRCFFVEHACRREVWLRPRAARGPTPVDEKGLDLLVTQYSIAGGLSWEESFVDVMQHL